MILPDNCPDNSDKIRSHYISQILTKLTSVVDSFSSLNFSMSNQMDGSIDMAASLSNSDNIYNVLLMCHKNLNYLKGFIRGTSVVFHIHEVLIFLLFVFQSVHFSFSVLQGFIILFSYAQMVFHESVCLLAYLFICLFVYLFICLFVHLFICLFVYLFIC